MTQPKKADKNTVKIKKQKAKNDDLLIRLATKITSRSGLSIREEDLDTLDDATLEALDKTLAPAARDELRKALSRLADAAEAYMSSDPEMPSHTETEREIEQSIEHARMLIKEG